MFFLIVNYRRFWGKIGVKRCQNWSQKRMKKVPKIGGVTWWEKSSDEKNLKMTPQKWCHDKLVLIGFKMTNGVRSFDGNV